MNKEPPPQKNSQFSNYTAAILPYFGNDEDRKLEKLLEQTYTTSQKFGLCSNFFPIAFLLLLPLPLVHSNAHRIRYFFNETDYMGTNFYGFPLQDGKVLYYLTALCPICFIYLFFFIINDSGDRFSRIEHIAYTSITIISGAIVAVFGEPSSDLFEFFSSRWGFPLVILAYARPLVLTLLQEYFPRKSRPFATAIFCASDSIINCLSYFSVHQLYKTRTVELIDSKILNWSSTFELCIFALIAIRVATLFHNFLESPYFYLNYAKEYHASHADYPDLQLNRKTNERSAFKNWWGINIDNVSQQMKETLRERCFTPFDCTCDGDSQNTCRTLFPRTICIQFACYVLQLPVVMILGNVESLFLQYGFSRECALSSTETLYIMYTVSSILSLFVIDLFSLRNQVLYTSTASSLLVIVYSATVYLSGKDSSAYIESLYTVILAFLCINGSFLVPATCTIIADSCGKNRLKSLVIMTLCNAVMLFLCQTILEVFGWSYWLSFCVPVYAIAMLYFWRTEDERWSSENKQRSLYACHILSNYI